MFLVRVAVRASTFATSAASASNCSGPPAPLASAGEAASSSASSRATRRSTGCTRSEWLWRSLAHRLPLDDGLVDLQLLRTRRNVVGRLNGAIQRGQ
jgi:hypothetical protein